VALRSLVVRSRMDLPLYEIATRNGLKPFLKDNSNVFQIPTAFSREISSVFILSCYESYLISFVKFQVEGNRNAPSEMIFPHFVESRP